MNWEKNNLLAAGRRLLAPGGWEAAAGSRQLPVSSGPAGSWQMAAGSCQQLTAASCQMPAASRMEILFRYLLLFEYFFHFYLGFIGKAQEKHWKTTRKTSEKHGKSIGRESIGRKSIGKA